jgi:hypothetical protein
VVALPPGEPAGAVLHVGDRLVEHGGDGGRVGAAIAYLLKDSLDGAVEQVTPMLAMPPEFRIATVTGWLADLDHHLYGRRYATSSTASGLRQQIREFTANALPPHDAGEAR